MSGTVIIGMGIALTGAAVILFGVGVIYQKTAGRKIREELKREYEQAFQIDIMFQTTQRIPCQTLKGGRKNK